MNRKACLTLLVSLCVGLLSAAQAQAITVPNASFENGVDNLPTGWSPAAGGKTQWENTGHTGNHSISVSATKESLKNKMNYFKMYVA